MVTRQTAPVDSRRRAGNDDFANIRVLGNQPQLTRVGVRGIMTRCIKISIEH